MGLMDLKTKKTTINCEDCGITIESKEAITCAGKDKAYSFICKVCEKKRNK